MSEPNRYGLNRAIPEAVALKVRQRCGFACVMCGDALIEYHHFAPPFKDCVAHHADGITLLCASCHDRAGTLISDDEIAAADRDRRRVRQDVEVESLRFCELKWCVIGSIVLVGRYGTLMRLEGREVLGLHQGPGGRLEVTASFFDDAGREVVTIDKNVIIARRAGWDIRLVRQPSKRQALLTVDAQGSGRCFEMAIRPGQSVLVRRVNMRVGMARLVTSDEGELLLESGDSTICLPNNLWFVGGAIEVGSSGGIAASGGGVMIRRGITVDRYRELTASGDVATLLSELGLSRN